MRNERGGSDHTARSVQLAALLGDLPARWWAVLAHPGGPAFQRQRGAARWGPIWAGLVVEAIAQGAVVWLVLAGPGGSPYVSSLPFGPKLRVPVASPWLTLAAFIGTFVEFFGFAAVLWLSARRLGGRGGWLAHCWLLSLFWVPLMVLSALLQLFGTAGSAAGLVARLYALLLLGPALAVAHTLSLRRAWAAVLIVVVAGLVLGALALAIVGVPAGLLAP